MSKQVDNRQFTRDLPVIGVALLTTLLSLIPLIAAIIRLRPHALKVPVGYIVHSRSVFQQDSWISLYGLVLAALAMNVFIIYVSYRFYKNNREYSLAVLWIYSVVALFSGFLAYALLTLVSGV